MARIKNIGHGTGKFNEGLIIDGFAGEDTHALAITGSVSVKGTNQPALNVHGDLSNNYVAIIDNDQSSNGHVLKLETDGNGSGSRLLEMVDGDGDILFRARADGRFGFGPDGVDSMGAGTFVVGIDNSSHTSDIAISRRLQHLGDSDTYLDFPSNNTFNLVAGGNSFLKYDGDILINNANANVDTKIMADDGNVVLHVDAGTNKIGIGTTSPDYALDVVGDVGVNEYIYHNGDDDTFIRFEDDEITINAGGRSFINLQEASTDKLVINNGALDIDLQVKGDNDANLIRTDAANDKVGIGTSTPGSKLDVVGTFTCAPNVTETKNALQGSSTLTAILRDESFSGLSNKDFTFSCWYYANDTNSVGMSSNSRVIFFGAGEHHSLHLGYPDAQIIYENHAGSNSTATFDSNLAEGNWYHVVAHFDVGDLSNGVPKLWINGTEQSSSGYSAVGGTAATIDDVAIYLDDGSAMQDAVFWDKLLTQDEINELYDDGFWQDPSMTSCSGNIVSWFKLGYEAQWAGAGFSAGDTLSGTQTVPDEIGVNEFDMTNENEFSLLARSVTRRSKSDFVLDSTILAGQVTVKDSLDVTNKSTFGGAVEYSVRDVNATSSVEVNDYVLRCVQMSAMTITLPPKNDSKGRVLIIKDALGNANTNNITLDADGSETIDGSATYVINHNKEAITLICDGINGWMIISNVKP